MTSTKSNLRERIVDFFTRQPRPWLFGEAVVLVAAIGFIDYITGYEVSFFPFYSIPILLTRWFGGRNAAILISILSAIGWWVADTASGHVYSSEWFRIWDALVRFMFFCLVIFAGGAFREQGIANRTKIELLERSRKLEQEIIGISECEQQRIGRDLHDGLGQHLVAIGFAADSLKNDFEREALPGAAAIGQIGDLIHDAVRRTRYLARGLSPVDRHEGGLESALEELALSTSRLTGVPCAFICDSLVNLEDDSWVIHLFRIAQEALNNAVKHSHATNIVVALDAGDGILSLRVSDNGVGFEPASVNGTGMGLNIMGYRARMIGGSLDIQSNSPSGTVVSCTIDAAGAAKLPKNADGL